MSRPMVESTCVRCPKKFMQPAWQAAIPEKRRKTCGAMKCRYQRNGTMEERLLAKVKKTKGCWLWTGTKTPEGYGKLWDSNINEMGRAHRMSYEHYVGPVPEGLFVCHHCDNPSCVNPDHLFLGNNDDNVRDKVEKGRQPSHKGKLDANVRTAIMALLNLNLSQHKIAEVVGVSMKTVCRYANLSADSTSEGVEKDG